MNEKKLEQWDYRFTDFANDKELMLTITLKEYRTLIETVERDKYFLNAKDSKISELTNDIKSLEKAVENERLKTESAEEAYKKIKSKLEENN